MKDILQKQSSEDIRLTLFAFAWAIATLFHYQAFYKWDQGYFVWMAAIWLMFKPSSLKRFVVLVSFQIIQELTILPEKHNHWLLVTIANLTILTTFIIRACRERTLNINTREFFNGFRPIICVELVILYFYAVFHKLNYDYFSLDVSSGVFFYRSQAARFTFLPDSQLLEMVSVYATLLFEMLIPLLLVSAKGRKLGILIAVLFHGIIGFNPTSEFWNFSSVIYALLLLFAPSNLFRHAEDLKSPLGNNVMKICLLGVVASSILINNSSFEVGMGLVLWSLYMALALVLILKTIKEDRSLFEKEGEPIFRFNSPMLFVFPIMLFLNGICPYVGLKTESSFAMFSNLRTEGSRSNHLLMRDAWQIFDYQKDLVTIKSSSDPYLNSLIEKKLMLTYYEFRKYAKEHLDIKAVYARNGKIHDLSVARTTAEFQTEPLWFYRSFLVFRPVSMLARTGSSR